MKKRRYNQATYQRLHKDFCEVCKTTDKETLEWHHIIERTELNTSNDPFNIAIICANCHALTHSGKLKIIGVYPSTAAYGRMLIYEKDGIPNVEGITEAFFKPKPAQSKYYGVNNEEEEEE